MSQLETMDGRSDVDTVKQSIQASIGGRRTEDYPYRHHFVDSLFPAPVVSALARLPFAAPALEGASGTREIHNKTRQYFDADALVRYPVTRIVAEAFQSADVVKTLSLAFDAPLDGTFLRLEYAQDIDGFWLEPHTDLGVKKFTGLIYLSDEPGHETLGTDIYVTRDQHVGSSPFKSNHAMIFVPGNDTWHGFEKRPISGIRRSVILNYVTHDWRAKEQLSFPHAPVRC